MSEFTSGNLFLNTNWEIVKQLAPSGALLKQLNKEWMLLLTKDNYMEDYEAPEYIYNISKQAPILYFYNFEDHFWGYRLFYGGEEVADVHISLEFEEEILHEIAMERNPDKKFSQLLFSGILDGLREELKSNNTFEEEYKYIFDRSNVDKFSLFGLDEIQINSLKRLLNIENAQDIGAAFHIKDDFKKALDIEEMSWIRHERILESQEYEEFIK
ncbi:hypothetical protein ASG89_33435 [Paenibacillus sp. Soil766]|uniref:hypothetical protein n=1 Tax=Paenibacillus sp. Soil766 TaxID=1736404 RepID=UPI000708D08B|nr:hypothetical protein [Paenibacillus sp. Soil766]KRE92156.1 hypothetical protein ASG89_33435 [Paenibacillus sp. Soil766]